jgi:hypothetical protein
VALITSGSCSISEARLRPSSSSAPQLIIASSVRRLSLAEPTRVQKSSRSLNGPPFSRSSTTASQAPWPTPLIAPRPYWMVSGVTASNMKADWFTLGGSTVRPRLRTSSRKPTTLSVLSRSDDSVAAMNSAG